MKIIIRITFVLFLTNLFSCCQNSENKFSSAEPEIIKKILEVGGTLIIPQIRSY